MKHAVLVLAIIACSLSGYGQKPDSTAKDLFPRHFISINPINVCLIQQAGLGYEYRYKRYGFGVTTGYVYASRFNIGRYFLARTANYGAFEFYHGFFCNPQVNFYFIDPSQTRRHSIGYVTLKGIYKYMYLPADEFHIFDNEGGDAYDLYRKMEDRCHIGGVFADIGVKGVYGNFVIDFNIGPGVLIQDHNAIVYGQGTHNGGYGSNNVNPPRHERWRDVYPSVNISLTMGGAW